MNSFWILMAFCTLAVTYAEKDDDHGEYGNYNLWRKTMCEKGTDEIYNDFDHCAEKEDKSVTDLRESCMEKVSPSSGGKMQVYMEEGCKDKDIFFKADECLKEHHVGYEEVEHSEDAVHCYEEVIKKHDLTELLVYMNEHSHDRK